MRTWGAVAAAALLLALAGIAQHRALEAVVHEAVELAPGVPGTLYWPALDARTGAQRPPVVILAHGWGANRGSLRSLARSLTARGYAALAVDLAGHGANRRDFPTGQTPVRALLPDLDAAVLYARTQTGLDGERVALLGHGLGADLVLEHASREPGTAAVIALSPARSWSGPYQPANALLVWGEDQRLRSPTAAREIGERLAGTRQIRVGRSYGSPERGNAIHTEELEDTGYLGLLVSDIAERKIGEWLALSLAARLPGPMPAGEAGGPGLESAAAPLAAELPALLPWSLLGFAASAALFWLLCGLLEPSPPPAQPPSAAGPGRLGALVGALAAVPAAVFLAGAGDSASAGGPYAFFPFPGAGPLLGALLWSGAALGALAAQRGELRPPPARSLLGAAALAGVLYVCAGSFAEPALDPWLGPARAGWALLAAAAALPFSALSEQLLRGSGPAALLPALIKTLLFALLCAASWLGWFASEWLLLAPGLGGLLLALELAALRMRSAGADPWSAGALQALGLGWFLASAFPRAF